MVSSLMRAEHRSKQVVMTSWASVSGEYHMDLLVTLKAKGALTHSSGFGLAWVWLLLCSNLLGKLTSALTVHALFSLMGIELVGVAVGEVANRELLEL